MTTQEAAKSFKDLAQKVGTARKADVLMYNGAIGRSESDIVIDRCASRKRRKTVFLILTTSGGNPHAAFRIARCLQHHYERFIAFVPGYCKSAGTLLALGAHELVMSPHAELGPLDIQVSRADEVGERSSVLTPTDALRVLQSQAVGAAVSAFRDMRFNGGLPTKMAVEVSSSLVGKLYSEIFAQIDPMRLGELERATRIAAEYGKRLITTGKNATEDAMLSLVSGYPSHAFVIDIAEARNLFKKVTEPSADEVRLAARDPYSDDEALVAFLNDPPNDKEVADEKAGENNGGTPPGVGAQESGADGSPHEGARAEPADARDPGEAGPN